MNATIKWYRPIKRRLILLALAFLPHTTTLNAQRASINTYADTSALACNIKALLDSYHDALIHDHTYDVSGVIGKDSAFIHNATNFLPWHRYYIHKMENLLHSKYYYSSSEMFPLYYWSPFNRIPDPFFKTNTDGSPLCDRAADIPAPDPHADTYNPLVYQDISSGGSGGSFTVALSSIWGSQSAKEFYTNLYGTNPTLCSYTTYRHLGMYLGPGYGPHGAVHTSIGGTLGGDFHEAPAASLFSVWHSYIDKIWHDWECDCGQITGADLYIPDSEDDDDLVPTTARDFFDASIDSTGATHNGIDIGMEPNECPTDYPIWHSDDIWVRNTNDGIQNQEHQNPLYTGSPVYVYVRVRNRGCAASSGNEKLKLYWASASTSLDWPNDWNGTTKACTKPAGGLISTTSIASLPEEGSRIYTLVWTPPNPADYTCIGPNTHFCLLARITDATLPNEGMKFAETTSVYDNTRNNNNIAWRNVTVDEAPAGSPNTDGDHSVNVRPGKLTLTDKLTTTLKFAVPYENSANKENTNILDFANITIKLNTNLYNAWLAGNKVGTGVQDVGSNTIKILSKNAGIGNLNLKAGVVYYITPVFRSKGLPIPPYHPVYKFDVIQADAKRTVGGERFLVKLAATAPSAKSNAAGTMEKIAASENGIAQMQLYPNPSVSAVNLFVKREKDEPARIEMWNTEGKMIYTKKVSLKQGDNLFEIKPDHLTPGVYLVSLVTGEERMSQVFLKK